MKIKSHVGEYSVDITGELTLESLRAGREVFIIADSRVYEIYKENFFKGVNKNEIMFFDAIENNKNIESALKICAAMAEKSFKRSGTMISIGGGIVQDVTGFAANIYNRGVKWEFVPTTLLAQCDSCIGGKTSLNFLLYKNILGTFYAPDYIYVYLDFVRTLSEDDYLSGLGEIAKFNIMSAKEGISLMEDNMLKLRNRDVGTLAFFVERSLEFKKKFIEEDEFDRGIRNLLNFGHTFGHAFETVSGYAVPHGQAVTLGLMAANNISNGRNLLGTALKERIEKICLNFISVKFDKNWFSADNIVPAMKKDKKRGAEDLAAVLFVSDLSLRVCQDIQPVEVERALVQLLYKLRDTYLID